MKQRRSVVPNYSLRVSNFAQISKVDIQFGDLTVLVGEQGSGKSLVLELFKLAIDGRVIAKTMEKYGLVFRGRTQFLSRYLGEGLEGAWSSETRVKWSGNELNLEEIYQHPKVGKPSVYFVPAHRTLTLSEGYPPTFQQFRPETPFVVRQFSEELRQVLIKGPGHELLFPQAKRLKGKIRDKINDAVFHGAELREDATGVQRQLKLHFGDATRLSYMTWTAGQREFIPLLLGLYYLLPAGRHVKRADTNWVVVEEPEMGLHPMAIMSLMLLVLDLLSRGYKVILSTHSPLVLDVVWAICTLKRVKANWPPVLKLFGVEGATKASARGEVEMAEKALIKDYRVHLLSFDSAARVSSQDISSLDPGSSDPRVAGWGGLTGVSGQIGKVISEAVASAGLS
jgi:hypothetical protein